MQIEFKWKWGSHTVEEMDDYCSLVAKDRSCDMLVDCAVQLYRTVNELIWTWKSSANKDSRWTTSCCFVFVLSSRLWSCDQTRYKHPACVIRSQVDRPGGINTCLHTNSVGFFTRRKKYLHVEHLPNLQEASSGLECVIHSNTQSL